MRDILILLPEIYILLTAIGLVISESGYHGEKTRIIHLIGGLGLVGALIQTGVNYSFGATRFLDGAMVNDGFALFMKVALILLALISLYASKKAHEVQIEYRTEFCVFILAITAFGMFLVSSANLLMSLVLITGIQVLGYYLFSQKKSHVHGTEAAAKSLMGLIISFLFIGFSILFLFGLTKTMDIYAVHKVIAESANLSLKAWTVSFVLLVFGAAAVIQVFPAYFWSVDASEGAASSASSFILTAYRLAGLGFLIRVLLVVFGKPNEDAPGTWLSSTPLEWSWIIATMAATTSLFGAFLAYRQTKAKRLISALVLVQSGILLLGILSLDQVGLSSLLYNLLVDIFAITGVFTTLSYFVDRQGSDEFTDLRGALGQSVPEGIALILFVANLVGIPPLPGFIGKFTLISAAARHGWNFLSFIVVIALLISSISAARFLGNLLSDFRSRKAPIAVSYGHRIYIIGLLLPLFLITAFSEFILRWTGASVDFILW